MLNKTRNFFSGKKTYIIGGLMATIALVNALAGDLSFQEFLKDPNLKLLLEGLLAITLRRGVEKVAKQ